jgi:hypothetical protein
METESLSSKNRMKGRISIFAYTRELKNEGFHQQPHQEEFLITREEYYFSELVHADGSSVAWFAFKLEFLDRGRTHGRSVYRTVIVDDQWYLFWDEYMSNLVGKTD